ncbi:hypothetical protein BA723_01190 [Helicobacter sp. CLO-3]|uniref:dTMP kinase n=1 Tax=Helicobacter sp. CLO-3 TaxID=211 RepID=UPI0008054690|nr:dTMP kinase [Helicobacter sp. CLO-3]OBV28969.1 hypothetical protein BA723_01190 [Helicobacter sp. CLO-3]
MYVVFEGIDTCGKSTQIERLKGVFPEAIYTKEPGGSALGVRVREMILQSHSLQDLSQNSCEGANHGGANSQNAENSQRAQAPLSAMAEFFLFLADRAEHIDKVIKPNRQKLIISDRSLISGIAYAPFAQAESINLFCAQGVLPELCIAFEIDKDTLTQRLASKTHDAIEARGIEYLLNIQSKILQTARKIAKRTAIINASDDREAITKQIIAHIQRAQKELESGGVDSLVDSGDFNSLVVDSEVDSASADSSVLDSGDLDSGR